MNSMNSKQNNPTLEGILEHSALFDASDIYKAIRSRYKSVEWIRKGARPRRKISMLSEIKGFNQSISILKSEFSTEKLTIHTNLGVLVFNNEPEKQRENEINNQNINEKN